MNEGQFWMVWSPEGRTPPQYQHLSNSEAINEARRLASAHPGQRFYIVKALRYVQYARPLEVELGPPVTPF